MARNFSIRLLRGKDGLRIKLKGDFDGSSALSLFEILKQKRHEGHRIFVDTSGMRRVYPFGRELFQSHFSGLGDTSAEIVFTGEKSTLLAPEGEL